MAELTEITAWFAGFFSGVITIAMFKNLLTGYEFLVGMGMILSIYGAHNIINDKFADKP